MSDHCALPAKPDRRRFLQTGLKLAAGMMLPVGAWANADPRNSRYLAFFHTHTYDSLTVCYKQSGEYNQRGMKLINHMLRDHRTGDIFPVDPSLLDFLYDLQQQAGNPGTVHIVSGFRSQKTNEMLRKKSNGIAKRSQHLAGKALDFRIPGTDTAKLRNIAIAMQRGGVGYYRESDFLHIDTGRVRYW